MLAVWILRSEIHTKSATSQSFSKYPYHCMHSHCILDCLLTWSTYVQLYIWCGLSKVCVRLGRVWVPISQVIKGRASQHLKTPLVSHCLESKIWRIWWVRLPPATWYRYCSIIIYKYASAAEEIHALLLSFRLGGSFHAGFLVRCAWTESSGS